MKCRKCGSQLLEDSQFCQYCGADVNGFEKEITDKKEKHKTSVVWRIVTALLLVVSIAATSCSVVLYRKVSAAELQITKQ